MFAMPIPVIAIFDIGKTNKKLLLFDESYRVQWEESIQLPEITDEDGYPCEDVQALTGWVRTKAAAIAGDPRWTVRAVNCSAYGASFVHVDREGRVIAPLYNYLKPYPQTLLDQFYYDHGGAAALCCQTASQLRDSLSSGLQLYRLKYEQPALFEEIAWSLHLPQYLSYVLGAPLASDITSIGCHTGLWDFGRNAYHRWVVMEGVGEKLPPLLPSDTCLSAGPRRLGIGLHDSSAALIPYLRTVTEPFLQLSTGTWCVSLNPFNETPLTPAQLDQDCLCYLTYQRKPVKAARLFAGYTHEQETQRLAQRFAKPPDYFAGVRYDPSLSGDATYESAYHDLIRDLVCQQVASTSLVLDGGAVTRILVDGGFSKNPIFMALLAQAFPGLQVQPASVSQASAIGAALCLHEHWNSGPTPKDLMMARQ